MRTVDVESYQRNDVSRAESGRAAGESGGPDTVGEKSGRVSGVLSAPLPLSAQEDPQNEVIIFRSIIYLPCVMLAGPKGRKWGTGHRVRKGEGSLGCREHPRQWSPRVWDMSEVYNPMYPTSSHLKSKGALNIICLLPATDAGLLVLPLELPLAPLALDVRLELLKLRDGERGVLRGGVVQAPHVPLHVRALQRHAHRGVLAVQMAKHPAQLRRLPCT
eukprot:4845224-Pyramimonas_sp.AAC.1